MVLFLFKAALAVPQGVLQLDLDHALRNTEPLRDPMMRFFIESRCNQDGAATFRKFSDCVFKNREIATGFKFLRLARCIVNDILKNGIDIGPARPARFEALTIRRKVERHSGNISVRVPHDRHIINLVETKPRLMQGFAREFLGAETPRQKDPEFIVSLDEPSA
jgi:hypothetical protein